MFSDTVKRTVTVFRSVKRNNEISPVFVRVYCLKKLFKKLFLEGRLRSGYSFVEVSIYSLKTTMIFFFVVESFTESSRGHKSGRILDVARALIRVSSM